MVAAAAGGMSAESVLSMGAITAASNQATKAAALMNVSQATTAAVSGMAKNGANNIKDAARSQ